MQCIKVLITNISYPNQHYGVQAILFSFIKKFSKHFDAEYSLLIDDMHYNNNVEFCRKNKICAIKSPPTSIKISKGNYFLRNILQIYFSMRGKKSVGSEEYDTFLNEVRKHDIIINLSGIQFIGNKPIKIKYFEYFNSIYYKWLAKKNKLLYLEYTKSYGPFDGNIYRFLIKKYFNALPFIFVRGENNLKEIKKLNTKNKIYSFPDISLALEPENKKWAIYYLKKMGVNCSKKICGISPSSVIFNTNGNLCGENHLELCKKIIDFYLEKKTQVIILPHFIETDYLLSKKLYEAKNNKKVFFISDKELTYAKVRAIIGLMDFYVTGRYHSVCSALYMNTPVIPLSWHTKYLDVMSVFLKKPPIINCRNMNMENALSLIKRKYSEQNWFDIDNEKKKDVEKEIDTSISYVVQYINGYLMDR